MTIRRGLARTPRGLMQHGGRQFLTFLSPGGRPLSCFDIDPEVLSSVSERSSCDFVPAFSIVADHQHREVLRSEVSTLLTKRAIREVGQEDRQAGFYSHYFLIPKCDGLEQVPPAL